jgi:hypothetical protein
VVAASCWCGAPTTLDSYTHSERHWLLDKRKQAAAILRAIGDDDLADACAERWGRTTGDLKAA